MYVARGGWRVAGKPLKIIDYNPNNGMSLISIE